MGKVIVKAHPETGAVATKQTMKDGREVNIVRLEQKDLSFEGGFEREIKKVAFLRVSDATAAKLEADQPFPIEGKIVIIESLTPAYEGQEPKRAGENGGICVKDGKPIYRQAKFTQDLGAKDQLIAHDAIVDNLAEITSADNASAEKL